MKKNNVILIIFSIIVVFVIIGAFLIFGKKEPKEEKLPQQQNTLPQENSLIDMNNTNNVKIQDGKKENVSTALLQERIISGLRIRDIKLIAEDGLTNFTAEVRNVGTQKFEGKDIEIIFKNEDGTEFERLATYLPDLEVGETTAINASIIADLSNAYDFTIE